MFIALGIVAGILGFLPLSLSMKLSRRSTSTEALTVGLYGLGGVAVSLVILVACIVACGLLARSEIVGFAIAEGVVFVGSTCVYVLYKNVFAKKRERVQ